MLYLFSQFGKSNKIDVVRSATAVETLHNATLMHDDVIDRASERHHLASINADYDNHLAVYSGDYLFVSYFTLISHDQADIKNIQDHAKAMAKVLRAEILQERLRKSNEPVLVKQYLRIASGKTAELFALSSYEGARNANVSEQLLKHAHNFGHYFGMAFQIIDDLNDISGDQGKSSMLDVQNGIYSLPIIYALTSELAPEVNNFFIKTNFDQADVKRFQNLMIGSGALTRSTNLAVKYLDKAKTELDLFPDGATKNRLNKIVTLAKKQLN